MQAGGSNSLGIGQIGNKREILENRSRSVEGAGERSSMSSSSSEKAWFETESSSAPAEEEPETEDVHRVFEELACRMRRTSIAVRREGDEYPSRKHEVVRSQNCGTSRREAW
jgi:hypothetical protein